jgi:hypothetical protein
MNTTLFCEPEKTTPLGWEVTEDSELGYKTNLNGTSCYIDFHFLAENDGFWQVYVGNKPMKVCYSLADSVKYCEEESLKVNQPSFSYSFSYNAEVFEFDNDEYHFTSGYWYLAYGDSLVPIYSDVLEEKLNKLYQEWKDNKVK